MTALSLTRPAVAAVPRLSTPALAGPAGRMLMAAMALQTAFLLAALIAMPFEDRLVNDINVWIKPAKFAVSLLSTLATVWLLLPLMPASIRDGRMVRWSVLVMSFWSFAEILYIAAQSARGRASHFNNATPIESAAYGLMGLGAVSIVVAVFVVGLQIARAGSDEKGRGLHLGAATGLMIGAALTLVVAAIMSSGVLSANSHWVGGIRSDAGGLWLMGWSRSGGDLRVPHFFATHLMQALPLAGLFADRFMPIRARLIVVLAAILGSAVVLATFLQALAGRPFL